MQSHQSFPARDTAADTAGVLDTTGRAAVLTPIYTVREKCYVVLFCHPGQTVYIVHSGASIRRP
jgi:hypothetical protein